MIFHFVFKFNGLNIKLITITIGCKILISYFNLNDN